MKKKLITPEKKPNLYLMWTKRVFWSLLVLGIVYGAGTFYPNPLAKKWANEQLRQEHTIWAVSYTHLTLPTNDQV